jgi:hypothetical protein
MNFSGKGRGDMDSTMDANTDWDGSGYGGSNNPYYGGGYGGPRGGGYGRPMMRAPQQAPAAPAKK